jgi:hypothetical protein
MLEPCTSHTREREPGAARPCRCGDVCEWSHEPFEPGIYCRREPGAARPAADPFNCPDCGAHDFGLNRPRCPHCGYDATRHR